MSSSRKRRASSGRRGRGLAWNRIGYMGARLVLITVAVAGSIGIVTKVVHPYKLYWTLRKDNAADAARVNALRAENERIQRRIIYLNTAEGKTAQARGQGYHKPDEHPLRTEDPSAPPVGQ